MFTPRFLPRTRGPALATAHLVFLGLAAFFTVSSAKADSTTGVVGFYPVSLPSGNSAWVCGLVTQEAFVGAPTTVTSDVNGKAVVTFSDVDWAVGTFPLHYAEPQSGICQGLAIDILSHTANSITLDTTPAAAGLSTSVVLTVRKHATIGGLLPTSGGLTPFSDSISIINSSGLQQTYYFNNIAGYWITGANVNSTNAVIRPGQGMIIQVNTAKTLMLGTGEVCHVKSTPSKTRAYPGVPNILGPINPLGNNTTLGALGVRTSLLAWSDTLVTLAPGSLLQTGLYVNTGSYLMSSLGQNGEGHTLPAGSGVVIGVNAAKNISLSPVTVSP